MPNISNPSKLPIFLLRSTTHQRLIFRSLSKPASTSPVPTHDNISHLILEQKSPSEALHTFRWASNLPNFTHSQSTYRALIHKLCTFRRFDTAHEVLDEMPNSIGSPPDEDIFVTIVKGLGKAKMIRQAIKVLDLVTKFGTSPSLKLFNSILDVLVKEDIDIAREFYRIKMIGFGVRGDDYTFGIMMKGLCLTNRIDEGFKLLSAMKSHGLTPNTVIYNTLLHGLCKNGNVGRARSLMNEVAEPNEVTFNIMISAYCREENVVQALVMLEKSFSNGFVPDVVTVTKILAILCTEDRLEEAAEVIERVECKGGSIDVVAYNTLVKGFCMKGKAKVALSYLKEMERKGCLPNVETYNTLIGGFCESGMLESAMDLFDEMKMVGISRNFVTYDTLVKGLCSGGRMEHALSILEIMEEGKGGSGGRVSPYNNIIDGFYKQNQLNKALDFLTKMEKLFPRAVGRSFRILGFCNEGNIEDAKRVYDQMTEEGDFPCALVYATLISGFCQKDCVNEAFELMNEMVNRGFLPVASTFNGVISGLCRESKVGSALELLENLVGRGCSPDVGSYIPIIDASCRKEDFGKAYFFLLHMLDKDIVPDLSTWKLLVLSVDQECLRLNGKGIVPCELPLEFHS